MPEAPVPIAATFFNATNELVVVFDRRLVAGAIDHGNWWIRLFGARRNAEHPASAIAQSIRTAIGGGILNPGADVVHYEPPPFDVLSRNGPAVAAFADFPLDVVP